MSIYFKFKHPCIFNSFSYKGCILGVLRQILYVSHSYLVGCRLHVIIFPSFLDWWRRHTFKTTAQQGLAEWIRFKVVKSLVFVGDWWRWRFILLLIRMYTTLFVSNCLRMVHQLHSKLGLSKMALNLLRHSLRVCEVWITCLVGFVKF